MQSPHGAPWGQSRRGASLGLALLLLAAALHACATAAGTGPLPELAEYAGREVRRVEFVGELRLDADSLQTIISTRPSECRLPLLPVGVCIFGVDRYRLELDELARDVVRLRLYYRDHGYYGSTVAPSVEAVDEELTVRFGIVPGDRVILSSLEVQGTEGIIPPEEIRDDLPLEVGEPFRRTGFLSSADSIRSALFRRGYAYADVLRNYAIDTIADVAEAQFIAIPGPVVLVDSIQILGADRLGARTVRQQLTFREGSLLRAADLNLSQRALYGLSFVNFASVQTAPDTLQLTAEPVEGADTVGAGVVVRVVEAAKYAVDASAGYGTIDCLRAGASWTNRNFLGGARRLEVSGAVSKIGVGSPADWALDNSFLCRELEDDPFSKDLNYRVAADFEQPTLLGVRNRLGVRLHGERISEFQTYLRESVGGQVAFARQLTPRTLASVAADVERGSTEGPAAVFCIGFDVCDPRDVARLQQSRWSNSLNLGMVFDRTRRQGVTTRGFQLRSELGWSSPTLGSEDEYLRLVAEGAAYRELRRGWVLAGHVQAGTFLDGGFDPDAGFIPPERRFYAGGPNSVRGFPRNGLGPRAYLEQIEVDANGEVVDADTTGSATGGTELAVVSAELRTPSPLLPQFLRLAGFVDAGQVWAPNTRAGVSGLRVTPGVGLRITTPVGPMRFDIAYNPYGTEAGPLYRVGEDGGLRLVQRGFQPEDGGFWDRLQFHFAVGQAF